jgi:alpha-tubulin suppressor-like RCC1 family protein
MKTIKYIVVIMCSIVISSLTKVNAQSMSITGGNDHSLVICSQGYLYAWGNNKNNQLGLKAPYNATAIVWAPQQVNMPAGLTFSQVTAGSGSHNVALACTGVVYGWGANDMQQTGQATPTGVGSVISTPTAVPKGATPGYNIDGTSGGAYLGNVKYIAASTNASFAILNTGELVGWGGGNWTAATSNLPQYIKKSDGTILKDVIHVSGGDNNALILVDPDKDGLGTLYSIGNWNGRGGDGSAISTTASPVLDDTGSPLTTIRTSGIMDVGAFAVDGVTGYVYGWGNGGWGCSNGISGNKTTTSAQKISSGQYKKISGEDYLTDAVQVIGGNGWGAAITKEGYLLYWGNNTPGAGNGGTAPNKTMAADACATGPQFAMYCNGDTVTDAVSIARGDMWGFMINKQNKYYVWGSNSQAGASANYVGTLGLGDPTIKWINCLQEITVPCEMQDQCPDAYMVGPMFKCAGSATKVFSGFNTPIGNGLDGNPISDRYFFTWYKDGVKLNTSSKASAVATRRADVYNKTEISVTATGIYNVEIEYIGLNVPCNTCKIAKASIEIKDKVMPIDTVITTSCVANPLTPAASDNLCYEFKPKYTVDSKYDVYKNQTGGTALQTVSVTAGTKGAFCTTGNNVTASKNATDTTYTIWLEDVTKISGNLLKGQSLTDGNGEQGRRILLEAWKPVTLTSFDLVLKSYYGPKSGTVTPVIYTVNKNTNGQEEAGAVFFTGTPQPVSYGDVNTPVTINLGAGISLPANASRGTKYFLGITTTGVDQVNYGIVGTNQSNSPLFTTGTIKKDDLDAATLLVIGAIENSGAGNPGNKSLFTNIKFNSSSAYDCGRMPIVSKYNCPPCTPPANVTITSTDADNVLCSGESTTLTTNTQSSATAFEYQWFKGAVTSTSIADATAMGTGYTTGASGSIVVNSTNPGTYYVRFRDNTKPSSAGCWRENKVLVKAAPAISYTITGTGSYCPESATKTPVVITFTGTAPFTFDEAVTGTGKTSQTTTYTINNPAAGTYKPTNIKDTYGCSAAASALSVTVQDLATPILNIGALPSACIGGTTVNVATYVTGDAVPYTYTTTKGTINSSGLLTLAGAGTYSVTVVATGTVAPNCKNTKSASFDIWAKPTVAITAPPATICSDAAVYTIQATPALGTFTGDVTSATFDPAAAIVGLNSFTYTYTDAHGCTDSKSASITVVKVDPPVVSAPNPKVIVVAVDNSLSEPSTLTATGTKTIQWMNATCSTVNFTGGTLTTGLTSTDLGALQDKTFTYKVRQKDIASGCASSCVDATIDLTRCPFTIPTVVGAQGCQFTTLASISASTTNTVDQWKWYQSDKTTPIVNNSSTYNHTVNSAVSGITDFYVSYLATDGSTGQQCESPKQKVSVTVIAKPATPVTQNADMCEGSMVLPLKTDNAVDKWYSDNAALVYTGTQGKTFTPTGVTNVDLTYYVQRDVSGCKSDIASAKLHIITKPTIVLSANKEKCIYGTTDKIIATVSPAKGAADFLTWTVTPNPSGVSNSEHSEQFDPSTYLTSATTYTIQGKYSVKLATQTCESDNATMQYVVYPRATKPTVTGSAICKGDVIAPIVANGSSDIKWKSLNGLPDYTGKSYDFGALGITTLDVGKYTFTLQDISSHSCESDVATVDLEIAQGAITNIIGDTSACENSKGNLYTLEYIPTKASTYVWKVTGNNNSYTKDATSPAIRYFDWSKLGIDTITVVETSWAGCKGYDTLAVKIVENPHPHFTWSLPGAGSTVWFKDNTIQNPIQEGTTSIPVKYKMLWDFGQDPNFPMTDAEVQYENRNMIVEAKGYRYGKFDPILTVENEYGCSASYTEQIFVDFKSDIFIPNAFAPTNPAYGVRTFQPVGFNIDECEIWVFDQWGNIVWYSNDVVDGMFVGKWDGTYNGEMLQAGVYMWKMKAKMLDGKKWKGDEQDNGRYKRYGNVLLIR